MRRIEIEITALLQGSHMIVSRTNYPISKLYLVEWESDLDANLNVLPIWTSSAYFSDMLDDIAVGLSSMVIEWKLLCHVNPVNHLICHSALPWGYLWNKSTALGINTSVISNHRIWGIEGGGDDFRQRRKAPWICTQIRQRCFLGVLCFYGNHFPT